MALIVGGANPSSPTTNIGKIVIVGKFTGSEMGAKRHRFYTNLWEVNILISYGKSGQHYYCPEQCMQRIDDDGEEEDENNENESRKVHQNVGVASGDGRR